MYTGAPGIRKVRVTRRVLFLMDRLERTSIQKGRGGEREGWIWEKEEPMDGGWPQEDSGLGKLQPAEVENNSRLKEALDKCSSYGSSRH